MTTSTPSLHSAHVLRRALGVCLSLVCMAGAFAAPPGNDNNATITVVSNPLSVSVTRAGGPIFKVSYEITVRNNSSNNNFTYDFEGTTAVSGVPPLSPLPIARFDRSSGLPCTVVSKPDKPTVVQCSQLSIEKSTSKKFSVTFITPSAGTNLRFTVKSTSNASRGEGFADTPLVTQPITDINLGFETFVGEEGGLFYTGSIGNGCGRIPGSWPSAIDPFTTTLIVPAINFTTIAKVAESKSVESCSERYTNDSCFESELVIPSAPAAFASLKIYLRIGPNSIATLTGGNSINNAVLEYVKGAGYAPIEVQSCGTGGPTSGIPCIRSRRHYGVNYPTPSSIAACNGVWEFLVEAVDNGLYRTR